MFENVGLNAAKILCGENREAGSVEVAADKLKDGMTILGFQLGGSVVLLGIMCHRCRGGGMMPKKRMMQKRKKR
jgi:hypothetical protein